MRTTTLDRGSQNREMRIRTNDQSSLRVSTPVASLREEGKIVSDLVDNFDRKDRESARTIGDTEQQSPPSNPNVDSTTPTDQYGQGWQTRPNCPPQSAVCRCGCT